MPRSNRVAVAAALAVTLAGSACTGNSTGKATDDVTQETTITFWHGWSAPHEVKAIQDNVNAFMTKNPKIKVKVVGNVNDDKINQALRAGGANAPDAVSSFTTDNVGKFCDSNVFADVKPFLEKSGINPEQTFPKPLLDYTQFEGKRCALPLLNDAYGLYYNKKAFAAAGITAPPKTHSEFKDIAKKLTRAKGDSFAQLGFMPNFHGYESTFGHFVSQWGPKYFDDQGKANTANDPSFGAMLKWQKDMVDSLGGFAKLEKYRATFGDEFGPKNPFHTGQVAMAIDGEWRIAMIKENAPNLDYGTAPFPVPDDQADKYGRGYLSGTIIGIASVSQKQNAAWELVKYLTTDTDAVVSFSNAIKNVPSTFEAQKSSKLDPDPRFKTFLDIAAHPDSNTTPATANGGAFQVTLQEVGYLHEAGKVADPVAALKKADEQIDKDIAKVK